MATTARPQREEVFRGGAPARGEAVDPEARCDAEVTQSQRLSGREPAPVPSASSRVGAEEAADAASKTGVLADFMVRLSSSPARARGLQSISRQALREVSRETMYAQIMDELTIFWKRTGHRAWAWPGRGALLDRVAQIVSLKRSAVCLRTEVDCVAATRKLCHSLSASRFGLLQFPAGEDGAEGRHRRLQHFWDHYHARSADGVVRERGSEAWRARADAGKHEPQGDVWFSMDENEEEKEKLDGGLPRGFDGSVDFNLGVSGTLAGGSPTSQLWSALSSHRRNAGGSPRRAAATRAVAFGFGSAAGGSVEIAGGWLPSCSGSAAATVALSRRPFTAELEQINGDASAQAPLRETWASSFAAGPPPWRAAEPSRGTRAKGPSSARPPQDKSGAGRFKRANPSPLEGCAFHGLMPQETETVKQERPRLLRAKTSAAAELNVKGLGSATWVPPGTARALTRASWAGPLGPTEGAKLQHVGSMASTFLSSTHAATSKNSLPPACSLGNVSMQTLLSLPPIETCVPPMLPPEGGAACELLAPPQQRYLSICQRMGVAPLPIPFVTGHSQRLTVPHRAMEDRELLPLATMVDELQKAEEIDLGGNAQLTPQSLVPLLRGLGEGGSNLSLVRLCLSGCRRAGLDTLAALMALLRKDLQALRWLDLTGIQVPSRSFVPLAAAVGGHRALTTVVVADTGLGRGSEAVACRVISELLASSSIEVLDLGWSALSVEVFTHLGASLATSRRLQSLNVPNCSSSGSSGRDFPIEHFLEHLAHARTLTKLDISLNRMDYRGALVLEDALELHRTFKDLDVTENALGVTGIRSVLRLLVRDTCGLLRLRSERCAEGCGDAETEKVFSATNPGGQYSLDLGRPYHRAFLRMLHKACERFSLDPQAALTHLVFSTPPFRPLHKDSTGVWCAPTRGTLDFNFSVQWPIPSTKAADPWDFSAFLQTHISTARLRPSFRKVVPLLAHWKSLRGQSAEQLAVLDTIAMDFLITFPQLQELARTRELTSEVICRTMHCLVGGQAARYLSLLLTPSLGDYLRNLARSRNFLGFNPDNPTWHYVLNLGNPGDYVVAEQLLLMDRWEVLIDLHLDRCDTSQFGVRTHMRNVEYQGVCLEGQNLGDRNLPSVDTLSFDYATGKRTPEDAPSLDEDSFTKILQLLHRSDLDTKVQINVLRLVSNWVYLRALQMRELLGAFQSDAVRANVFALFYFRVIDMHNEKVFRVRFEDPRELDRLHQRLGYATCFPFVQPERSNFRYELQHLDQRVALSTLVSLMAKEQPQNVRNPCFVDASGVEDPLTLGIPRSWEWPDRVPKGGVFTATYICAPEHRRVAARKALCEKYGHWRLAVRDEEVLWWTGLGEVPPDVRTFTEWLTANFDNVMQAFRLIDGPGGNGVVTLREFEDRLRELGCGRFTGPDEAQRFQAVFRYLDPSGEGGVSESEWQVLKQLWNEMMLTLEEFVKFLGRAFDHRANLLMDAWAALDDDGSGQITEDEWNTLVHKKLKYFGPSTSIFHFLDAGGEGTVSLDEFKLLERFL